MGDLIKEFTARAFARVGQQGDASPWGRTPPEGLARVKAHVEQTYGVDVAKLEELDAAVFDTKLVRGQRWITRVFSAARPLSAVEADAAVLRHLEAHEFPAERVAAAEPVSTFDDRGVLVTEFVEGPTIGNDPRTLERIGELLGRLHTLPLPNDAAARPAGSWHHISHAGGPRSADADVLRPLLQAAKDPNRTPVHLMKHIDALQAELDAIDDGGDLPQSVIHIDFGGPNVIETPDDDLVGIDWAGSGVGARIASLAALMATGGDRKRVEAFVRGYRTHVELDPVELDRLGSAIRSHSLVLDAWTIVFAPAHAQHVVDSLDAKREKCETIAALVRDAYSAPR